MQGEPPVTRPTQSLAGLDENHSGDSWLRAGASTISLLLRFRAGRASQTLVFSQIEPHNHFVGQHERRRGPAIEIVSQNPQVIRIRANVSFFKGNTARNQEFLRFDARSAA